MVSIKSLRNQAQKMNSLLQDWGVTEELSEGKRMRVDLIRVATFNMIGSCINRRVVS